MGARYLHSRPKLEEWLRDHIGITFNLPDVINDAFPEDTTNEAISSRRSALSYALAQIGQEDGWRIEKINRTHWIVLAAPKGGKNPVQQLTEKLKVSAPAMFETVGQSNGTYLIRDEDGNLFKAVPFSF